MCCLDCKTAVGFYNKGTSSNNFTQKETFLIKSASYENALEIFRADDHENGIEAAFGNLYLVYQAAGDRKKAEDNLKEFIEMGK